VRGPGSGLLAQLEKGGFVSQRNAFRVGIPLNTLEIFIGKRLDGLVLGLADPGDSQFHGSNLTTSQVEA
jgi:hypothetical protein